MWEEIAIQCCLGNCRRYQGGSLVACTTARPPYTFWRWRSRGMVCGKWYGQLAHAQSGLHWPEQGPALHSMPSLLRGIIDAQMTRREGGYDGPATRAHRCCWLSADRGRGRTSDVDFQATYIYKFAVVQLKRLSVKRRVNRPGEALVCTADDFE